MTTAVAAARTRDEHGLNSTPAIVCARTAMHVHASAEVHGKPSNWAFSLAGASMYGKEARSRSCVEAYHLNAGVLLGKLRCFGPFSGFGACNR